MIIEPIFVCGSYNYNLCSCPGCPFYSSNCNCYVFPCYLFGSNNSSSNDNSNSNKLLWFPLCNCNFHICNLHSNCWMCCMCNLTSNENEIIWLKKSWNVNKFSKLLTFTSANHFYICLGNCWNRQKNCKLNLDEDTRSKNGNDHDQKLWNSQTELKFIWLLYSESSVKCQQLECYNLCDFDALVYILGWKPLQRKLKGSRILFHL